MSYSQADFLRLFEAGSLFLHHCFDEGILWSGHEQSWRSLGKRFVVQKDFSSEIGKCISTCRLILKPEIFGGHYLAPFVNAYTQLKNASIFFLAQRQIYRFNKDQAIREAAALLRFCDSETITSLRDIYDYSVRGLDLPLPFPLDSVIHGNRVLRIASDYMKRISDACC